MTVEFTMKQIDTLLKALSAEIEVTRDIYRDSKDMDVLNHLDNLIDTYIQVVRTLHP